MLKKQKIGTDVQTIIAKMVWDDKIVESYTKRRYHETESNKQYKIFKQACSEWYPIFLKKMPKMQQHYRYWCKYENPNILIMVGRKEQYNINYNPETNKFSGSYSELNVHRFEPVPASQFEEFLKKYSEEWHPVIRKWFELNPFIKK